MFSGGISSFLSNSYFSTEDHTSYSNVEGIDHQFVDDDMNFIADWIENNIVDVTFGDEDLLKEILYGENFDRDLDGRKRRRSRPRVKDWWSTAWGLMIRDPLIRDITNAAGKNFRRRFRIPATFCFDWLIPRCRELNIFGAKHKNNGDIMAHQIPIEFKVR
jgi:hypothetical protein